MSNNYQPIHNIAELCAQKGINQVILCPGSRCAPLTLAFARHPGITTRTIPDERSAGFIALGIAQQRKSPVVLVCTSGTAAYNFAPAIAEAHFNEVPLLIITADRPAEWIGQHDGQTIHQHHLYGPHVKQFYQLPQEYEHADSQWAINRMVNEAINLSYQEPKGPVHINAPFREPFYPKTSEDIVFDPSVRVLDELSNSFPLTDDHTQFLSREWKKYHNILILAGQHEQDTPLMQALETVATRQHIPVIGDLTANMHGMEDMLAHVEMCLAHANEEIKKELKPDLLITFGKSIVAKNIKLFLRKHQPTAHWHIQPNGNLADTYQSVTHLFRVTPTQFFKHIETLATTTPAFETQKQINFKNLWAAEERRVTRAIHDYFPRPELGELEVVKEVMAALPNDCNLHLANSMSVRYANLLGLASSQKNIQIYCNRGTSGIDGCTSTTVGHVLVNPNKLNVLITGDLAFFYDRNAFWHNYPLPNLRILLLNNHGGIIFKMIDGPGNLPEADEYFVTNQRLNARKLSEEFNITYLALDNRRKLKNLIPDFLDADGQTKILEFESESTLNTTIFDGLKKQLKAAYEK